MKLLNMVIPILLHFCSFISDWCVASCIMPHIIQRSQTFAGYTVANFGRSPIRHRITKASALEYNLLANSLDHLIICYECLIQNRTVPIDIKADDNSQQMAVKVRNIFYIQGLLWASTPQNLSSGVANNKGTDQPAHPRRLISAFVIRLLESIISKLASSEISIC